MLFAELQFCFGEKVFQMKKFAGFLLVLAVCAFSIGCDAVQEEATPVGDGVDAVGAAITETVEAAGDAAAEAGDAAVEAGKEGVKAVGEGVEAAGQAIQESVE